MLRGGVLRASSLGNGGTVSTLGAASSDAANLVFAGGTLMISGTSDTSTDRGFTVGAGSIAMIDVLNPMSVIVGGSIIGTGSLNKSGPGTLSLAVSEILCVDRVYSVSLFGISELIPKISNQIGWQIC